MSKANATPSQELIDAVLEQISRDAEVGDYSAIEELLRYTPESRLRAYLPIDSELGPV
jgi:hypothetical protein